jgi:hypothetical protein
MLLQRTLPETNHNNNRITECDYRPVDTDRPVFHWRCLGGPVSVKDVDNESLPPRTGKFALLRLNRLVF